MEETDIMLNSERSYTREFKQEAVALLESSGQSAVAIERELGITPGLLSRWRRNQKAAGQPTNGQRKETGKRIQELERENACLYQEREILKK